MMTHLPSSLLCLSNDLPELTNLSPIYSVATRDVVLQPCLRINLGQAANRARLNLASTGLGISVFLPPESVRVFGSFWFRGIAILGARNAHHLRYVWHHHFSLRR